MSDPDSVSKLFRGSGTALTKTLATATVASTVLKIAKGELFPWPVVGLLFLLFAAQLALHLRSSHKGNGSSGGVDPGGQEPEDMLGKHVVAVWVPLEKHKKVLEKATKGRLPGWGVQTLSPSLRPCDEAGASHLLFYRTTPVALSRTTDTFTTADGTSSLRIQFEARVSLSDVRRFVSSAVAIPGKRAVGDDCMLDLEELGTQAVLGLTDRAGAYTIEQLKEFKPGAFAHLLAPGLAGMGFKVEAARIVSIGAESAGRTPD